MIFVLDNYDSFTYNLVQYLGELGADLQIARNDQVTPEQVLDLQPEGIVLSPGPGRPENAGILQDLITAAQQEIPILGVCLGHQGMAQVHGARIGYAPSLMHGKTSQIYHNGSSLYSDIESPFVATRYHSLVVEPDSLPDCFEITAWTDDKVIMGIRHRELPMQGVQFHPESILTECGKQLLKNFLESL